jgi:hypothetical protein
MLIERNKDMSETKNTRENETEKDASKQKRRFSSELYRRALFEPDIQGTPGYERLFLNVVRDLSRHKSKYEEWDLIVEVLMELLADNDYNLIRKALEARTEKVHGEFYEAIAEEFEKELDEAIDEMRAIYEKPTTIPLRIIEEPLKPQNLALAFTTLTELATKFWLIAKHRLSDLIEYTQTHDIRFADEAGSTIAWATYSSPFSFGFQVDKLVPSVADALMTVVNGLSQRKAHVEKLELDNQAAEQKIKEDEKKSELEQTKEQLAIERERVALLRETMEAQKQGIEYAIEITKTLVDITYPNADIETKGMIITTLLPGVLQLDNVRGLQLVLPETLPLGSKATLDNTEPQQDAGQ